MPVYCDKVTIEGALQVIENIGRDKVLTVIPSRYQNNKTQKMYHNILKESFEGKEVIFTEPVVQQSFVEDLIEKGKTIWETKSKKIVDTQEVFLEVLEEVLHG